MRKELEQYRDSVNLYQGYSDYQKWKVLYTITRIEMMLDRVKQQILCIIPQISSNCPKFTTIAILKEKQYIHI